MKPLDYSAASYLGTQLHTAQTWGNKEITLHCDAVVVGAGPGGLTTAATLAKRGLKVIVVDGGNFWKHQQFQRKQSSALKNLYQDQGTRIMQGNAFIPLASGRGIGGGTLVNSGISFRAPDDVLDSWVHDHGVDFWKQRDRLYAEVEARIGVAPTLPAIAGNNTKIARRGLIELNANHAYMPRNTPGCAGCGTCQTGCPTGGKASSDLNWLPDALRHDAQVFANVRVQHIMLKQGRAVGVRGILQNFETQETQASVEITADKVILAAGAINTPLLLLNQDLANSSSQVGENLHVQPGCGAAAHMPDEVHLWQGATQGYFAYHPTEKNILLETFSAPPEAIFTQIGEVGKPGQFLKDFKHLSLCGFLVRDSSAGSVRPSKGGAPTLSYTINEADFQRFITGLQFSTEVFFAAGAKSVRPLVDGSRMFNSMEDASAFIQQVTVDRLLLYASHPMGTCQLGTDPKTSVARTKDGRTHDVEGLYITDSSLHPTAIGANPQLTIMAQSLALAQQIANH